MRVEGEEAKGLKAVRRDTLMDVPGELVLADDQTGEVQTRDKTGEVQGWTFGPHLIRIVSARR